MRLFLDAKVPFTAAYSPGGRSRALVELARADRCTVRSSNHAIKAALRNISLEAPTSIDDLSELVELLDRVPEADPRLVSRASELGLPDNDAPILAAAVAARVDALITGDRRHVGHLFDSAPGGVAIIPPSEALGRLLG